MFFWQLCNTVEASADPNLGPTVEALCNDVIRILSPQPVSCVEVSKPASSSKEDAQAAAEAVEKSEPVKEAAKEPDAAKEKSGSPRPVKEAAKEPDAAKEKSGLLRSADGAGDGGAEKAEEGVVVLDD